MREATDHHVVAIVPARGGSKTIPRKNLIELNGLPLVGSAVRLARESGVSDRVIVSTDDNEIAEVARDYGGEILSLRDPKLSQDDTPDAPVCITVLQEIISRGERLPDYVIWLRPTSPLTTPGDIAGAVNTAIRHDADYVRSICQAREHPYWLKRLDGEKLEPFLPGKDERTYYQRQLLPPAYRITGAVDVFKVARLMEDEMLYNGAVLGFLMPQERSFEIDEPVDVAIVKTLLEQRGQ